MARDVTVYKRTRGEKNIVTDRNTSGDGGVYANPHTVSQNWRAFSLTAVLLTNDRTEAKHLLQNGANRGTPREKLYRQDSRFLSICSVKMRLLPARYRYSGKCG